MLSHFQNAWAWLREWLFYILPALSNLILVLLGVILSLPTLAEKIEKTPKYRTALGVICLIAGIVGFWFDVGARRSGDQTNRQLLGNVGKAVNNTNDLVQQTKGLVATVSQMATTTSQMAATVSISVPQLSDMKAYIAAIDRQLKTTHDPRLIAELQAEKAQTQKQADAASRQLLLAMVPTVVQQMDTIGMTWDGDEDKLFERYDDAKRHNPSDSVRIEAEKNRKNAELTEAYLDFKGVRQLIVTGNLLKQQLFQQLQPSNKQPIPSFAVGDRENGYRLRGFARGLQSLAEQVAKLPPTAP
jgi:hypothetical protein